MATVARVGEQDYDVLALLSVAALDGISPELPANPTAQVGPSAINGSASTFMRSDAAPKLADTAVTPNIYGDATHIPVFNVDQQGRLIAAANQAIAFPARITPTSQKIVPTTGFSQTIANNTNRLLIVPAGGLLAGTVVMPASPADDQEVTIASTQAITTLIVNGSAGQTVLGGITTLAANDFATWHWVLADTTWYRVG